MMTQIGSTNDFAIKRILSDLVDKITDIEFNANIEDGPFENPDYQVPSQLEERPCPEGKYEHKHPYDQQTSYPRDIQEFGSPFSSPQDVVELDVSKMFAKEQKKAMEQIGRKKFQNLYHQRNEVFVKERPRFGRDDLFEDTFEEELDPDIGDAIVPDVFNSLNSSCQMDVQKPSIKRKKQEFSDDEELDEDEVTIFQPLSRKKITKYKVGLSRKQKTKPLHNIYPFKNEP